MSEIVETPRGFAGRPLYLRFLVTAYEHTLWALMRRKRTFIATGALLFPLILPLLLRFYSNLQDDVPGTMIYAGMAEMLYLRTMVPLLSLFYGAMLIGEEIESQTISYLLTRPVPRSAWVIGRFLAFGAATTLMLWAALALTFLACALLPNFDMAGNAARLGRYLGIAVLAVLGYGGVCMAFGAWLKRPIITGLIFIFGWQRLTILAPGVVDFFTVEKYVRMLMPMGRGLEGPAAAETQALSQIKAEVVVSPESSVLALLAIAAAGILITTWAVRWKEHTRAIAVSE